MRISDWSSDVCSSDLALNVSRETLQRLSGTPQDLARRGLSVNADGQRRTAWELLGRSAVPREQLVAAWPEIAAIPAPVLEQLAIESLYAGYLERQEADIRAFRRDEALALPDDLDPAAIGRSEAHTSELQSLMRISYAVFCLKTK